jgi:hypothetical protein
MTGCLGRQELESIVEVEVNLRPRRKGRMYVRVLLEDARIW